MKSGHYLINLAEILSSPAALHNGKLCADLVCAKKNFLYVVSSFSTFRLKLDQVSIKKVQWKPPGEKQIGSRNRKFEKSKVASNYAYLAG